MTEYVLRCVRLTPVVLGAFAFIAGLLSGSSEDPAGESGLYAGLVAFCAATLALSKVFDAKCSRSSRWWDFFIGLGTAAAAYLWMASEAEVSPLSTSFPLAIALLFAIVGVLTFLVASSWFPPFRRGR